MQLARILLLAVLPPTLGRSPSPRFDKRISEFATEKFARDGIRVLVGKRVTEVRADQVVVQDNATGAVAAAAPRGLRGVVHGHRHKAHHQEAHEESGAGVWGHLGVPVRRWPHARFLCWEPSYLCVSSPFSLVSNTLLTFGVQFQFYLRA